MLVPLPRDFFSFHFFLLFLLFFVPVQAKRRLNKTKQGDTGWGSVVYTPKQSTLKVIQGHYQLFLQQRKQGAAAAAPAPAPVSQVGPSRSRSQTTLADVGRITTSSLAEGASRNLLGLSHGAVAAEGATNDPSTQQGQKLASLANRYDQYQQLGVPSAGPPILFAFIAGACSAWEAARAVVQSRRSENSCTKLQREFLKACNVFIVPGKKAQGIIEVMPCPVPMVPWSERAAGGSNK